MLAEAPHSSDLFIGGFRVWGLGQFPKDALQVVMILSRQEACALGFSVFQVPSQEPKANLPQHEFKNSNIAFSLGSGGR